MSVTTNEKKFVMKHVFKDIKKMENLTVDGPIEYHYGIPWKFQVYKNPNGEFDVFLDCLETPESTDWSIIGYTVFTKIVTHVGKRHKKEDSTSRLLFTIVDEWYSDHIVNGNFTVKVSVQINKVTGNFEKEKLIDFGESNKEFSDVVVKIGDQKFHVKKMCLASHSTYFESLFLGNFLEKSEIELKDIDPEHFQNFLELIYGEYLLDDDTVEGVLNLADFFDSKTAIRRCEEFLLNLSKLPLKVKFDAAIKCQLEELKKQCISEMKTQEDVKSVLPENHKQFETSVLAELFEKATSFK